MIKSLPMVEVFSDRNCMLGEGAFWHPVREQFFWFDILGKTLLTRVGDQEQLWQFREHISAAGWIDRDRMIVASASALWQFECDTGSWEEITPLEADNPHTRSNDGRADPYGGFWIGTMGYNAEHGAGAIYRYYRGELRRLYENITISNAICFSPDGHWAYFTDTADGRVFRQALDSKGWPKGDPLLYLDFRGADFGPDGAVIDADGYFWNAQWGAHRVARYDPEGQEVETVILPTPQASCPAFGGPGLRALYITTAADGRPDDPAAGQTYRIKTNFTGQAEHQVIL